MDSGYSLLHLYSYIQGATVKTAVILQAAESGNTWLWFKVLQVDLILIFSDVLMPPHHHNRKLELERQAQNDITRLLYIYNEFKHSPNPIPNPNTIHQNVPLKKKT